MVYAGVNHLISQQPVEEFPADQRQVLARLNRAHKPLGPIFGFIVRQTLKNTILKTCQHYGYAKSLFIFNVIA